MIQEFVDEGGGIAVRRVTLESLQSLLSSPEGWEWEGGGDQLPTISPSSFRPVCNPHAHVKVTSHSTVGCSARKVDFTLGGRMHRQMVGRTPVPRLMRRRVDFELGCKLTCRSGLTLGRRLQHRTVDLTPARRLKRRHLSYGLGSSPVSPRRLLGGRAGLQTTSAESSICPSREAQPSIGCAGWWTSSSAVG